MAKHIEYVYGSEFIHEDISEVNVLIKIMNEVPRFAVTEILTRWTIWRECKKRSPFIQRSYFLKMLI